MKKSILVQSIMSLPWVGNVTARTLRRLRYGAHVTARGTLRRVTLRRWVRYGAMENHFKLIKFHKSMGFFLLNKPNLGYNWANKPKPKPEPKPRA
jgi:hypothetical protein